MESYIIENDKTEYNDMVHIVSILSNKFTKGNLVKAEPFNGKLKITFNAEKTELKNVLENKRKEKFEEIFSNFGF